MSWKSSCGKQQSLLIWEQWAKMSDSQIGDILLKKPFPDQGNGFLSK